MNLRYLLASVAVCAAVSANAADVTDFGEVKPDAVYEYSTLVPVSGYYTPEESGVLRAFCTGDQIGVFKDEDHMEEIFSQHSYYSANGEKARIYPVTKGETIYFYHPAPIAGGSFRISVGKEKIELGFVDPSPDKVLSISTAYRAEIAFNIPVKCSKCKIEVNGMSAELPLSVVDSYIDINWFNTLLQWYREGKINEGDEMTLTITGIRDEYDSSNRPDFGDGLGKLILKYKMAGRPVELRQEIGTPNSGVLDFLSYYIPGGEKGLVSLVFSGDLDPNCHPAAEILYGDANNIEAGMYVENPPVSIDGKTLTVDLRGVSRLPEVMIPALPAQSSISLSVSRIKSTDGQYVLTGSMASPYTFGFSYNLRNVVYSIAADWVPASGSVLNPGSEMEIWVLNGRQIAFDSVDFSYLKEGNPAIVSVPYSDLRVENDTYDADALLYYLSAPAIDADPDSQISVTFGGLRCADGLDHSSDILARYKASSSGVEGVMSDVVDDVYYDLTGRRVLKPSIGIYIRNGRKVIF